MPAKSELFSLVVPVLNEQDVVRDTYATLNRVLEGMGMPFEVVVVDNGSSDETPTLMAAICAADPRWKFIRLSRNFGYQNSITAGMLAALGDAIMIIDADLQDPPELIPAFIAKWRQGYDIVYGVREKRTGESPLRVIPTMLAMRFITWMSDEVKLPLHSGDFRLITRRVRDAFAQLPETTRYVRGMVHWLGFRQCGVRYVRRGRLKGESKVNLVYLVGFMFNAVFNFSVKPLRIFSLFGASVIALTGVLALIYVVMAFFSSPPPGITTVLLLLLANLGILSLGIGILGEYIAKIYTESKRRPLWLVDYTLNWVTPENDQRNATTLGPGFSAEGRGFPPPGKEHPHDGCPLPVRKMDTGFVAKNMDLEDETRVA
jgi:glycosyltransferase involved in cell wall biosynthesis